ncbi:MAG: MBL fold metallo-hydrolase [Syntrophorhabdaceae bacterium]|nr:MBL fold metallo-hydrolase [Syntrophorhabdaceae bacterium]
MIFQEKGHIVDNLYVTGIPWSPVYLLGSETPVLFEAGFYCMGRYYERDIKNIIKDKKPPILFLTHVHWDHCGAVSYLKNVFPGLKIAASKRAAEIIERPNAQRLIDEFSRRIVPLIENIPGIEKDVLLTDGFKPFVIDVILEDNDRVSIEEGLSVEVLNTPGHTRDMLSYYIPEKKILFATEAAGCMGRSGKMVAEFIVDFDLYIRSLKRLAELDVAVLCQGHHFVFTDESVKEHFKLSFEAAETFKKNVEELIASGVSEDDVVTIIKSKEYDPNPAPKQLEMAYLMSLKARVSHIASRYKEKHKIIDIKAD